MRSQEKLFTASALIEAAAGLPLVSLPALAIWLLLGVREPSPEALITSRIGGAALLAIAVACWLGRTDRGSSSQHGVLWALLLYNVGAFAVLALTGSMLRMAGVALWPAVGLHAVMTIWCALNLRAWHTRAEPTASLGN
jgi:hypothetical protein